MGGKADYSEKIFVRQMNLETLWYMGASYVEKRRDHEDSGGGEGD